MGTVNTTSINSRRIQYKDIAFTFLPNPNTGDIGVKKDVEAIRQSVMNIITTSRGERPFSPLLGGNLRQYLFEPLDHVTVSIMRDHIVHVLGIYEPRVEVIDFSVEDYPARNEVRVNIEVIILTAPEITTNIEFTVERIR